MRKFLVTIFLLTLLTALGFAVRFYFIQLQENKIKLLELQRVEEPQVIATYEDFDVWVEQQQKLSKELFEAQKSQVTLFAVGDIMMSRAVEKKMLEKKDFSYCLAPMKKIIQSADIAFANFESPIIEGPLVDDGSFVFRANPMSAASLLDAGFDIVSLANNHFGNFGQEGMTATFKYLTEKGIAYVGAGENSQKLVNPKIIEKNNLKIAFLAYSYGPDYYQANNVNAGFAMMNETQLVADIKKAQDNQADVIIVSMHDGIEYTDIASAHQSEFAHLAIDSGADLVIGHHPHVVQEMEIYKNKYIFYSLGNFVFDQMWSEQTRQGLGVMFVLNTDGVVDLDYYPVIINDYCQPNLILDNSREEVIDKL